MSHLLCLGFGYSARYVALRLAARGWRITGTARTRQGAEEISRLGFGSSVFDGARSEPLAILETVTHVLVSIPPDETGDAVLQCGAAALASRRAIEWIGYLSTVGIYGDRQGGWVDERTPPAPASQRSRQRIAAETQWLAFAGSSGRRVEIFRLAGIYGPGRSVLDDLRRGTARRIVKPGQVFNRIHVEDIATTLLAAIASPGKHEIYNVADDEPAPSDVVVAYAAKLLQVDPPPPIAFADADLSPMAASFYAECKCVSNARLKRDLGVTLAYPTYREGIGAIVRGG